MMKPLSYYTYFKSNKKKVLGIILSIGFSILLIGATQMYFDNMSDSEMRDVVKFKYLSYISGIDTDVPKDILEELKAKDVVERIIPVNIHNYLINNIIGGKIVYSGFYADEADIRFLMEKMDLKLSCGDYIKNGDNKAIINENIARARKLNIGDYVGSDANNIDVFKGKFQVSGVMEGDNIISFLPKKDNEIFKRQYLIVPKDGKIKELNAFLTGLPKDSIRVLTYEGKINEVQDNEDSFNIVFNLMIIVIAVVLAITLGNANYVHYFHRRKDFGLLKAIGYGKNKIINLLFMEIGISSLLGLILGVVLLLIFKNLQNIFYLYPKGMSLFRLNVQLIPRIMVIPVFIFIFSVIPITRLLVKIEPVTIIERVGV
jgi:ABC-type antimicrobial peptide transport system permease subunit